jgi:hypothetical protein
MRNKRELNLPEKDLLELDKKVHELAVMNFELFCKLLAVNKEQAYVCFEIQKGKSYKQIGIKMKLAKQTVYLISKKCK